MSAALRLTFAVTVAGLLVGCSKAGPAAADNAAVVAENGAVVAENGAAAPVVKTAVPAATPAATPGAAPSSDYMVGKWSAMAENCAATVEFRKDGSVVTPMGDAKWSLDGARLKVDFGDGAKTAPSSIKVLGPDRIEITKSDGKIETQKRC